jgi:hypothetical protein
MEEENKEDPFEMEALAIHIIGKRTSTHIIINNKRVRFVEIKICAFFFNIGVLERFILSPHGKHLS